MVTIIRKFGKKVRRATRAALQNSASMLGQIEERWREIRVVKAAGSERFERPATTPSCPSSSSSNSRVAI